MGETVSKTVKRPAKNAGMFSKGSPRPGPGRGHKKPAVKIAAQRIVEEMEQGYQTDQSPTESLGVTESRKLARNDYPKFLAMYLKAKELAGEMEPRPVGSGETVTAAATEAGPKEELIESLAKRLLDEWDAEERGGSHGGTEAGLEEPPEDREE